MEAVELKITGHLDAAFVPWICHRAHRLDLKGWVVGSGRGLDVVVAGPAPLIDAMEVACSLGPACVMVDDIARRDIHLGTAPTGFAPR